MNEYKTLNIVSVANPSAELERTVSLQNQDWVLGNNPDWLMTQTHDAVLFSAGGNDTGKPICGHVANRGFSGIRRCAGSAA